MTNAEIEFICDAIRQVAENIENWKLAYQYDDNKNEFVFKRETFVEKEITKNWFNY
jgi:hypothetical protein